MNSEQRRATDRIEAGLSRLAAYVVTETGPPGEDTFQIRWGSRTRRICVDWCVRAARSFDYLLSGCSERALRAISSINLEERARQRLAPIT